MRAAERRNEVILDHGLTVLPGGSLDGSITVTLLRLQPESIAAAGTPRAVQPSGKDRPGVQTGCPRGSRGSREQTDRAGQGASSPLVRSKRRRDSIRKDGKSARLFPAGEASARTGNGITMSRPGVRATVMAKGNGS